MQKLNKPKYPEQGSETGLYDSEGKMIHVGDYLKMEVTGNVEYHGEWTIYEVAVRGMVPALFYITSEKGDRFPKGYTGCALSDKYEAKMLLWGVDLSKVTPYDQMVVVDRQTYNSLINSPID